RVPDAEPRAAEGARRGQDVRPAVLALHPLVRLQQVPEAQRERRPGMRGSAAQRARLGHAATVLPAPDTGGALSAPSPPAPRAAGRALARRSTSPTTRRSGRARPPPPLRSAVPASGRAAGATACTGTGSGRTAA